MLSFWWMCQDTGNQWCDWCCESPFMMLQLQCANSHLTSDWDNPIPTLWCWAMWSYTRTHAHTHTHTDSPRSKYFTISAHSLPDLSGLVWIFCRLLIVCDTMFWHWKVCLLTLQKHRCLYLVHRSWFVNGVIYYCFVVCVVFLSGLVCIDWLCDCIVW